MRLITRDYGIMLSWTLLLVPVILLYNPIFQPPAEFVVPSFHMVVCEGALNFVVHVALNVEWISPVDPVTYN